MDVNNNFNQNENTNDSVNNTAENIVNNGAQNNFNNAGNMNYNNMNNNMNYQYQPSSASMSPKTAGIVAYITWIGFIIAVLAGDKNDPYVKFHLNQALVLNLFAFLSWIPLIGSIWAIFIFVLWIIALVGACSGETKQVPLLGDIHILK